MTTVFFFFVTIFFARTALAKSSSAEVSCRAQAKETAVQQYTSCITIARNNQVDEIRKSYQKELANLKVKYDKELKRMGSAVASTSKDKKAAKSAVPSAKELKKAALNPPPVAMKGIARDLPGKMTTDAEVMPVQTVLEETKVVAVDFEEPSSLVESEAAENEKVEMIEMPVE